MANNLKTEKKVAVISMLCEGSSIRAIERITGVTHVEKQNHTLRMHCRRLTRLTNAFRKKVENFEAAVALNFAYYNFCKVHGAIRMTPAMAAGVANRIWKVADVWNSAVDEEY